ncbi:Fe-S-cluster-containing dehydrogenase component [Parasporobacterium paucivorans DSM 15970]|uniref:Fe-S-cluster-containing dehydrogenase component n=2 Tax=Parasporobacterium TaxID=115543 RepID=A0A1M6E5R2_9FIRM|nr:Fe-S-cluster-containing dehydrogenase component [Parasporobacterium paucivorans DSM 15970]
MMKQKYIVIDVRWCHDCNNCFMGCKDEHVDNNWEGYTAAQPRHGHRWMNIERRERGKYSRNDVKFLPMPCQHCENAPCVAASKGAITRREDGIVMIDMVAAKGNKELVDSCPYGAIYWNDEADIAQKCTMCAHLLDSAEWAPKMPRCVHNCPTGSMSFYDCEPEEMAKLAAAEGLEAYKAELGTNPHVLYKNLFMFTKNFVAGGITVDGDCFENATVTLEQDGKVLQTAQTNFFGDFKFDGLEDGEYTVKVDAAGKAQSSNVTIAGKSLNLGFIAF